MEFLSMLGGRGGGGAGAVWGIFAGFALLSAGYFYIFWDKRKDDSANKDDGQVGLKLALFTLMLVGLAIAAGGLETLFHYLVSGAKTGKDNLKLGLSGLVSGGAVFGGIAFMLLPRTNSAKFGQVERFALGTIAVITGIAAIMGFAGLVQGLFTSVPWGANSGNLATILVNGGIGFFALSRFGAISGWQGPPPRPAPMAPPQGGGYPPQGGGYPPQGGGYPPQGGGYPPQGGGYPPQGGGYPPQGGGYPPQQGGGYPPQQGGGLPPPAGGGYPPR